MRIMIFYFSGTGNTEYISRYISKKFNDVTITNMEEVKTIDLSEYDGFMVGYPVYACTLPKIVKNFLKKFPYDNKPFYLFSTKGFYSGIALNSAAHILKRKGYLLRHFTSITMPGSDALAMMKKDSKMLKKMVNKDFDYLPKIDTWIKKIQSKKKKRMLFNPLNYLISGIIEGLYLIFEKKLKKKFYANNSCINCYKCEKHCPVSNITVTGDGVEFHEHCMLCMRCIHQCPTEAIQIGKLTIGKYRYKGPKDDFRV